MTQREFLNSIISNDTDAERIAYAKAELAKLDARNAKRASKPSKVAIANAPVKEAIVNFLREHPATITAEVASGVGISTQKASSLLTQLCDEEKLSKSEVKLPKVGKRMAYSVK